MRDCYCIEEAYEDGYNAAVEDLGTVRGLSAESIDFLETISRYKSLPYHVEVANIPDHIELYLQTLSRKLAKLANEYVRNNE